MLFLRLTGGAAFALLRLPGWERERVSDALMTTDPRPAFAKQVPGVGGEALEIWIGERRVQYRVYKDDAGDDQIVIVSDVI